MGVAMSHPPVNKRASYNRASSGSYRVPYSRTQYLAPWQTQGFAPPPERKRRPLVRYDSSSPLFAGAWTMNDHGHFLALATVNEAANNCVHIVSGQGPVPQLRGTADALVTLPQTKVAWDPLGISSSGLRLLSTGDCLRLWNLNLQTGNVDALCPLVKKSKNSTGPAAPLTSFDWSSADNTVAITSSIDTTCTLWDLESQSVRMHLIAHDSDVYDVAFLQNTPNLFVSAGADGSARLFDLRSLDSSTFIRDPQPTPLLRIATSPGDSNMLAAIGLDRPEVFVIDIRAPWKPLALLEAHQAPVNSIAWAPPDRAGRNVLASGGDDCQVLVWDLMRQETPPLIGNITDQGQVNGVMWSPDGNWVGSISGRSMQGLAFR